MSPLMEKLKKLLALTASPEENEARTAAWLLVETCRKNGVTICFKTKGEEPIINPAPRAQQAAPSAKQARVDYYGVVDDFEELLRDLNSTWSRGAPTPRVKPVQDYVESAHVYRLRHCMACGGERDGRPIHEDSGRFVHIACSNGDPPETFVWRPITGARIRCAVCGNRFLERDPVIAAYGTTVHARCA